MRATTAPSRMPRRSSHGFVKLVSAPACRLLGATFVGPHAGAFINGLAPALC
jgi:pyruvate/2-oxoglutarate dehydrogenase complex dihydrolipoamide dehydrogenase (E3) component